MSEEKKNIFDKAVDALTNRDEKEALEKAQKEAAAAKKEAADMRTKMAADKRAKTAKASNEKAASRRAAAAKKKAMAQRTAAAKTAADKVTRKALMEARTAKKIGVVTEGLKLRSGPGEEFNPPIGWLKTGDKLEIQEELEYWLKVKFEGKEGYVGKKYVKFSK